MKMEANGRPWVAPWASANPAHVTAEQLDAWSAIAKALDLDTRITIERMKSEYRAAVATIVKLFGDRSRMASYLRANEREMCYPVFVSGQVEDIRRRRATHLATVAEGLAEKKRESDRVDKMIRAAEFLRARGKVHGVDWTGNPIRFANELAFDGEQIRQADSGPIRFGGDDNCEDCDGWDGSSNRCACGNRRVGWECDGDFENPVCYGQAH